MDQSNFKKEDIYKYLSKKKGYSILFSQKIINDLIDILIKEIKCNSLNLKNIGTFKIIEKRERMGRNPKTKEIYKIKARKSLSFKQSKNLLKQIDNYNEKVN